MQSDNYLPINELKKKLFIKMHHVESLSLEFEKIMLLPKQKRDAWVEENEGFLSDMLDAFMQDSMMALDGMELDQETMRLSVDFVTKLREVMSIVRSIVREKGDLEA